MNEEKYLPIGSIVKLKGGEKRVMIFGILQQDIADTNIIYDYVAVLYPEGNMGVDFQYLFNHEDIGEIIFIGYSDDERELFIKEVISKIDEFSEVNQSKFTND